MGIQITPVLCGMIQENAYIVAAPGRGDCVVVDPGDEYPKLKRAVGNRRVAMGEEMKPSTKEIHVTMEKPIMFFRKFFLLCSIRKLLLRLHSCAAR